MPKHLPSLKELVRYFIAGVGVSLLDFLSYSGLVLLGAAPSLANILGMVVGFISGFWLHKIFSFQYKGPANAPMFVRYLAVFIFNLCLAYFCMNLLLDASLDVYLSKIAVMAIVFASSFILSKLFVFNSAKGAW